MAKKKRRASPTRFALRDLKKMGFVAQVVERRLPGCFITQDLFGCIDIIALRAGIGILGIQATGGDGGNHAARRNKALGTAPVIEKPAAAGKRKRAPVRPKLREWLEAGGRFEIWSYRKAGAQGKRKLYALRREELTLDDLPAEPPPEQEGLPFTSSSPDRVMALMEAGT